MNLTYGRDQRNVPKDYTDYNYARNLDNQKSTSSYMFMHVDGVISWRSKLQ